MKLGFLGLGKMGSRMAKKLVMEGHDVVGWNRTLEVTQDLQNQLQNQESGIRNQGKLIVSETVGGVVQQLDSPKVIWSMLPAGEATENILQELLQIVEPGDIVIDGGNANFHDTQRRYEEFKNKGIRFLGIGVSGGVIAATEGYPLMVGGDKSAYEHVVPILDSLAKTKGGHAYVGEGGAGHFIKMVHNGIEYGLMQSLAEGFDVLEHSSYKFDLLTVAKLYQRNTLVSGFMLDRLVESLEKDPHLENLVGVIAESGEATWTIEEAAKEGITVPSIELALDYRRKSQIDETIQKSFTAKMVAALRNAFGGHSVTKKE